MGLKKLIKEDMLSDSELRWISENKTDYTRKLLARYHVALRELQDKYDQQLTWSVDDVMQAVRKIQNEANLFTNVTFNECEQILDLVLKHKDASIGINHETIETAARMFLRDRDMVINIEL